jgi:DNA-binding NarL/FixJ family response regulator
MKRYRILIADDHAIVRDGLRYLLGEDFDVLGTVEDGRTLLKEVERLKPDLVLIDISMPMLNGIETARQLRRLSPRTKIVVLTMHADVTLATEVFEAGASGYVLKDAPSEQIRIAIRDVLAGRKYVTPRVAQEVLTFVAAGSSSTKKRVRQLTTRQREVLQLLAEGRTGREIADLLCVSPRTVEFHKYRMMQELGLHSTAELTQYALKHGVISV